MVCMYCYKRDWYIFFTINGIMKYFWACLVPCFRKLLLRIVFENTENTILVFFENCSSYPNLVFSMFFRTKKNWEPNVFSLISLFYLF